MTAQFDFCFSEDYLGGDVALERNMFADIRPWSALPGTLHDKIRDELSQIDLERFAEAHSLPVKMTKAHVSPLVSEVRFAEICRDLLRFAETLYTLYTLCTQVGRAMARVLAAQRAIDEQKKSKGDAWWKRSLVDELHMAHDALDTVKPANDAYTDHLLEILGPAAMNCGICGIRARWTSLTSLRADSVLYPEFWLEVQLSPDRSEVLRAQGRVGPARARLACYVCEGICLVTCRANPDFEFEFELN